MKKIVIFFCALISLPAQAEVFSCSNPRIRNVQFKIEDGEWYQRPSARYGWRAMNCGTNDIECDDQRGIFTWRENISNNSFMSETIYLKSGRWIQESFIGSYNKNVGSCEIMDE